MLGVFAEFETNLRRERQMEGISKAKAAGIYKGRKPSVDAAKVRELRAAASAPPRSPSVSGLVARASTVLLVHEVEDAERAHGALGRSPCRRQGQGRCGRGVQQRDPWL